jgi:proton-translocating NADH-quinone oxidoreductase chain N
MHAILPLIILILGAYISYIYGKIELKYKVKYLAGSAALIFFIIVTIMQLISAYQVWTSGSLTYTIGGTLIKMDALSVFIAIVALILGTVVCLYSIIYMDKDKGKEYYYPLLLLMVAGILGIGLATDLLVLYLFFELMSIPSFALVAFRKNEWMAIEAGMKYIIMSAVGSAFAIFGISLIYLQTGSLNFNVLASLTTTTSFIQIAILFLIIGFGVKSAIVPLHTWLPDAHSVAPSSISAMLSGIIIGAGFFTLLRALIVFNGTGIPIGQVLIIMALITMSIGNLMAYAQFTHKKQVELKRILAYSSIAQMGYVILGVGIGIAYNIDLAYTGGLFHIMTHAFMKGLAFLCAGVFIHYIGTKYIDEMQGVGLTMKFTGFAFVLSLLSLAGIPPLSGFMSEWMIFGSSIMTYNFINLWGIAIAAIALVNTLIALGYYLPIIKIMYLSPKKKNILTVHKPSKILMIAITILASLTILLGIWPELGLRVVKPAVDILMAGGL